MVIFSASIVSGKNDRTGESNVSSANISAVLSRSSFGIFFRSSPAVCACPIFFGVPSIVMFLFSENHVGGIKIDIQNLDLEIWGSKSGGKQKPPYNASVFNAVT